jgi:hypothetical protein
MYDWLKRLKTATNPENGTISYIYDSSGNVSTRQDGRGIVLAFAQYDGLNRPTGKSYSDGVTAGVSYCYDGNASGCPGATQGGTNVNGQLTYSGYTNFYSQFLNYDAMGRIVASAQVTGGISPFVFSYSYDLSGALSSVTYPSGRVVAEGHDAVGRISQVSGSLGGPQTSYFGSAAYAPQGALQSGTLGNGIKESWAFNVRQQPSSVNIVSGQSTLMALGFWLRRPGEQRGSRHVWRFTEQR